MTTVAELIAEVERHVLPSGFEYRNALSGSVTNSATTWTFSHGTAGIAAGSLLACELEEVYVVNVDTAASSATVVRGQGGSAAAAHSAAAVVQVNPRASKWAILRAVNDELRSLSSPRKGLYKVANVEVTYNSSYRGYDLTGVSSMIGEPLSVLREPDDSSRHWMPIRHWRFESGLDAGDFPSTRAIFLGEGAHNGKAIRVKYRTDFTSLSASLAANVETVSGIPTYALNALHYGTAIRILEERPAERSDIYAQGDSKRAEEVTVSDTLRAPAALRERYDDELASAVARLTADNPVRLR